MKDTTPLGLVGLCGRFPRVAGNPQPWAEGWNPVGILNRQPFALPQRGNVSQPRVTKGWNTVGILNHQSFALPQRGNVLQPRVAVLPLPWFCRVINHPNPNGVVYALASRSVKDTTPLGLVGLRGRFPRVAGNPQPWAEGWNPFGILRRFVANAIQPNLPQRGNVRQPRVAEGWNPFWILRTFVPNAIQLRMFVANANQLRMFVPNAIELRTFVPNAMQSTLPQRGNVHQPKVAVLPLPWVCGITHSTNPNGVVSRIASESIVKAKQRNSVVRAEMEGGK